MLNSRIHDMAKELWKTCIYKFAFVERSRTMKAPVGLLSDRTVCDSRWRGLASSTESMRAIASATTILLQLHVSIQQSGELLLYRSPRFVLILSAVHPFAAGWISDIPAASGSPQSLPSWKAPASLPVPAPGSHWSGWAEKYRTAALHG